MNKPTKTLNPSWPLWLIGGLSAAAGSLATGYLMMSYHQGFVEDAYRDQSNLKARIAILEVALNQAQPYVLRLDSDPPPVDLPQPASPTAATPPAAQASAAQQPGAGSQAPTAVPKPPAPGQPQQPAKPAATQNPAPLTTTPIVQAQAARPPVLTPPATSAAKPVAPVAAPPTAVAHPVQQPSANASPLPPQTVAAAQAPVHEPPKPAVTPEELASAMKGRIEGVSSAKAGIKKLDADAVEFLSGRRVRVGEIFPSGEKLLNVDPSTGRIITNQRQLIIFFEGT